MGVDAAEAGQPVQVAAQVQLRQGDGADVADGDFQHLAVPAQVHQHLPVQKVRVAHQYVQQAVRQEGLAPELGVVQLFQLVQRALADARQVAVNHDLSSLEHNPKCLIFYFQILFNDFQRFFNSSLPHRNGEVA